MPKAARSLKNWAERELKAARALKRRRRDTLQASLAARVTALRKKRGLSQRNLAVRLRTSQQAVSDIETLKHDNLTVKTLERLARALDARLVVELR